ncbi:hypothetical protein D910_10331 [Dendroctonus ponderosae]|uniref:Uncharacterized protein n=1 Tax=Dendroctonus ponderosae TaxID=77166 RepID=U4UGC8_DENPD|nr:hypothetical protein D910_10331 [Dendroctonus ponderosae]
MVLESGVLPPPLQLYAAAAAHLAPRPPWAPLLQFPGAAQLLGQFPGAFSPLNRPRYPHGLGPGMRAPPGPPSEDSGSELNGKGKVFINRQFSPNLSNFRVVHRLYQGPIPKDSEQTSFCIVFVLSLTGKYLTRLQQAD